MSPSLQAVALVGDSPVMLFNLGLVDTIAVISHSQPKICLNQTKVNIE